MKLGINPSYFYPRSSERPLELLVQTAELCRDHGFSQLDTLTDLTRPDYLDFAKSYREALDARGIAVHQSHAPYYRYKKDRPLEEHQMLLSRAVEVAAILGSRYLVIHADEYRLSAGEVYDARRIEAWTYDYFAPAVTQASRLGVEIAVENLFEDWPDVGPLTRFTSRVEELVGIIERLRQSGNASCCWDFGHARCSFQGKLFDAFCIAFPYITCTHVHDNYHGDDHLLPTLGNIDWKPLIAHMKAHGYAGNLTYELVYGSIPQQTRPNFLEFARKTGEYLLSL